jgi:hypothetical protein
MAVLLKAAVDTIKARAGWPTIYKTKDVPDLHNAAMQAVSNTTAACIQLYKPHNPRRPLSP